MASVVVAVLALTTVAYGCAVDVTTTTAVESSGSTTTDRAATAKSSSTSTTQPLVVWQTLTYEQDAPGLEYGGRWVESSDESASAGSFVHINAEGGSLTFRFVGSYCGWVGKTSDLYGKAKVTIDGNVATVDLYSEQTTWRHAVWETKSLPFGDHQVTIKWTGKKNAEAKGTHINVDALQIVGALIRSYQQNHPLIEYAGTWKTSKIENASGGSFAVTKWSGSSMTVRFTGIRLDWYAKEGPEYGKAQVIVDGGKPVVVDLYSSEDLWRQKAWSSGRLDVGQHVVEIRWTGTKQPKSTGTYISVDRLEIAGAAE